MIDIGMRIGYVPASPSLSAPADRRRFAGYAKRRGLIFEIADPGEKYDLVVLTQRADLSRWSRYEHDGTKIVYDAVDSYMAANDWKAWLRGTSKFLTRQSRRWQFDYRAAVRAMCSRSDAVICSTEEQLFLLRPYCDNVHVILDLQDGDLLERKRSYEAGNTFNVVWEGLASSGIPLRLLRDIIEPATRSSDIAIHIVTDLVYFKYHDRFVKRYTSDDVEAVMRGCRANVFLYQWNPLAISAMATSADLALLPVDGRNAFHWGKPENKLLLFWRLGVPVLASPTPAYKRAMQLAGLDMTCSTPSEWADRLSYYRESSLARRDAGNSGYKVASENYSEAEMLKRWDRVLASLFRADCCGSGAPKTDVPG
jgi:hypothetical protein